jgi:LPXTG-motif cell wall-anchored protein
VFRKFATILLVVIFMSTVVGVVDIYAAWRDNSGDLPGTGDGSTYLIIGGVVAASVLVYLLIKKGSDEDQARLSVGHPADVMISVHPAAPSAVDAAEDAVASRKQALNIDPIVYVNQGRVGAGLGFSF